MIRYISFLRAINVGGHFVKMDHLRGLFESLGFANVETFISSGNVIFDTTETDAATLEKRIEHHLRENLGYEVTTFLRSTNEIKAIAEYQAFNPSRVEAAGALHVAFTANPPNEAARQKLQAYQNDNDAFVIHHREIYWLCQTKISDSNFSGAILEKAIGMPATMRNITTVKKLAAKYGH